MSERTGPTAPGGRPSRRVVDGPAQDAGEVDCADVVLRLFEFIDNEAAPDDTRWIQAHLRECASCLRQHDTDRRVKELVRRACGSESAPDSLRGEILSRITGVSVRTEAGENARTTVRITEVTRVHRDGEP